MISIVVPTHNNPTGVERLLRSLEVCPQEQNCEILIVANPPCEEVRRVCRRFEKAHYLQCPEIGVNRARNLGLQKAKFPVVLFLDDDCLIDDSQLLKKHLALHDEGPQVLAFGGLYHLLKSAGPLEKVYHFIQMSWLYSGLLTPDFKAKYLIGGHFSIKKSLLKDHSFDEHIRYGGSELEFFLRLGQKNFELILTRLSVAHASKNSLLGFLGKARKQAAGKAYIDSLNYQEVDSLYFHFERSFHFSHLKSFGPLEKFFLTIYQKTFSRSYLKARKRYQA